MDQDDLVFLMKKHGFSERQIHRIDMASSKDNVSILESLTYLSKRLIPLVLVFIFIGLFSIFAPILNGDDNVFIFPIIMIVVMIVLMKLLSFDLSIKAKKVIKEYKAL